MKIQFHKGKIPKKLIARIGEGQDYRDAVIGYKYYFISFNLLVFAFKIRKTHYEFYVDDTVCFKDSDKTTHR